MTARDKELRMNAHLSTSPIRRPARLALVALLAALAMVWLTGCAYLGGGNDAAESSGEFVPGAVGSGERSNLEMDEAAKSAQDSLVAPAPETYGTGADAANVPAEDRLVIRTVGIRVEVDDVDVSVEKLRAIATKYKANVTALQVSTDEDIPIYRYEAAEPGLADGAALSGYMTVRVPAESLEAFSDEAAALGKVLKQSENESDVTQEHIDLTARLKNLQAQEARLREFFDKATKVEEMLSIEQELGRVRGEIEAMQAQIAYLERQAAMSTVTIELTEPAPVVRPSGTDWGFVDAITQSIRAFVGTINVMIVLTGGLLPLILLGLVVFLVVRMIFRRRKPTTPPPAAWDEPDEQ
jgi:predicted HicB family RNase H-like nuclease